jgi:hypothetical protein
VLATLDTYNMAQSLLERSSTLGSLLTELNCLSTYQTFTTLETTLQIHSMQCLCLQSKLLKADNWVWRERERGFGAFASVGTVCMSGVTQGAHVGNRNEELWGFKLLGLRMKRAWVRRIIYHNCIERLSMYRQLGLTTSLSVAETKSISMSFMCDPLSGLPAGTIWRNLFVLFAKTHQRFSTQQGEIIVGPWFG